MLKTIINFITDTDINGKRFQISDVVVFKIMKKYDDISETSVMVMTFKED